MARQPAIAKIEEVRVPPVASPGDDVDIELVIRDDEQTTNPGEETNAMWVKVNSDSFDSTLLWNCASISPGGKRVINSSFTEYVGPDGEFTMPNEDVVLEIITGGYVDWVDCYGAQNRGEQTDSATVTVETPKVGIGDISVDESRGSPTSVPVSVSGITNGNSVVVKAELLFEVTQISSGTKVGEDRLRVNNVRPGRSQGASMVIEINDRYGEIEICSSVDEVFI